MARPTTVGTANVGKPSKASTVQRRQRDDSFNTASSDEVVSDTNDDGDLPTKKSGYKATSGGRRIVRDSDGIEEEGGSDTENSRGGQRSLKSSQSHGKPSAINNGRIDVTTSKARVASTSSISKISRKASGKVATSSKTIMQPLQPSHQHQQNGSIRGPAASTSSALRSPVRTVSLNAAQEHAKRRLSGKVPGRNNFSGLDEDGRRASLPSSLRKATNERADGDTSAASIASTAAVRQNAYSSAHNSPSGAADQSRHPAGQTRPEVRRTSSGVAAYHGGVGALNAAAALHRQASGQSHGLANLGRDAPIPIPVLSQEAMATNYEEWMKMATDNKINSSNAWSFALIDYFHDMSLLRNADDDGSINFQKASCTLDGCVKIWTSRVDSVATETGKLLNGLSGDAAAAANADEDDEDADDGAQGENGEGTQRPKKKKATRAHTTTLAASFEKLQVKDLDLEFTVDPLFKKTSADFDEGGAAGLLMNHLGSDSTMRVVFDAGDAKVDDGDDANEDTPSQEDEQHPTVDLSKLRAKFLPDVNVLQTMAICPSLSAFKFSADPNFIDLSLFSRNSLEASTSALPDDATPAPEPAQEGTADFFDQEADIIPQGGSDDMPYGDSQGDGHQQFYGNGGESDDGEGSPANGFEYPADGRRLGAVQQFDPRMPPGGREVVINMDGGPNTKLFDFFDSAVSKNWAGPEHWKMRRTIRAMRKADEEGENVEATTVKRKRVAKAPFTMDFSEESLAPDKKVIWATSTATTTLSGKRKRGAAPERKEAFLLPDDIHFSSQQLLTLFQKPKAAIHMRKRVLREQVAEGEVDEHYWAAAAAAQHRANVDDDDDDDVGMPLPFDTQFFHDDGDVPDFEEDLPMGGDEFEGPVTMQAADSEAIANDPQRKDSQDDDDLLAAAQTQLKRARPQFVSYAKKAKRVDVKQLKENIWKELALEMPTGTAHNDELDDDETPTDGAAAVGSKEFITVVSGLRKLYPAEKMEEISTSFCFICLLHLANEQGLRIQADGNEKSQAPTARGRQRRMSTDLMEDMENTAQFVGGLERLRIRRE